MGFLSRFYAWTFGKNGKSRRKEATVESVASSLEQYADRCARAGDLSGERDAREAARSARAATTYTIAKEFQEELYRKHGLSRDGQYERPDVGMSDGHPYTKLGSLVRGDGTRNWRNNNPGYIHIKKDAESYGAIGNDDYWAVFRTEQDGHSAFARRLRDIGNSLESALRVQIPPQRIDRLLQEVTKLGLCLTENVSTLSEQAMRSLSNAVRDLGDWQAGIIYDLAASEEVRATYPAWVQEIRQYIDDISTNTPPSGYH